ncbi:MAG: hydrogenase/urease accessory protein HupE [Paraglaciecola sp.]|jgi:hydrogenase/urease accessory protein HupE
MKNMLIFDATSPLKWVTFTKPQRFSKRISFLIFCLFFIIQNAVLQAHESRPLYLKITEDAEHFYFEINVPNTVNEQNLPTIYLNKMAINEIQKWTIRMVGYRQKWQQVKGDLSLKGTEIKVAYPAFNPVLSTIIAITYFDEAEQILLIPPTRNKTIIPKEVNASEVRKQYSILGIEHIWAGIDHLLFLVCLLIITGFSRRLLMTITGFTIAHSITLILSALKVIQLPIPPIEATIALSIVFLCYEIIHHHQDKNSLTYRYPILVASSFGLLHGLGFAAVLGEIGLPTNHRTEALLFFNVGVEIGQVVFIVALLLVAFIFQKIANNFLSKKVSNQIANIGLKMAIYGVGIMAAYWMFDRISG